MVVGYHAKWTFCVSVLDCGISPRMVVEKVIPLVPAAPPARTNISWCFKPLFMWMRFLGIELDPTCNPFRQITYFCGLLILFTCQWASISLTANGSFHNFTLPAVTINTRSKNLNISKSATFGWNVWIDVINHFTLMSIVCPAFFYIAHSQRWLHLLDVMKKFHFSYRQPNRNIVRSFAAFVGFVPILSVMKSPSTICHVSNTFKSFYTILYRKSD